MLKSAPALVIEFAVFADMALMRTVAECKERAEECRRLAHLGVNRRDWGHLEEMARTWDLLAKHKQEKLRWKTAAIADRCRNVLSLSDIAPKEPG